MKTTITGRSLTALTLTIALISGACSSGGSEESASTTTVAESGSQTEGSSNNSGNSSPGQLASETLELGKDQFSDKATSILLQNLAVGYNNITGVWEGSDPTIIPWSLAFS